MLALYLNSISGLIKTHMSLNHFDLYSAVFVLYEISSSRLTVKNTMLQMLLNVDYT